MQENYSHQNMFNYILDSHNFIHMNNFTCISCVVKELILHFSAVTLLSVLKRGMY